MFFVVFCDIHWRSFLSSPHLTIHPVQEWSGSQRQVWFCFVVSNDELLWPFASLKVDNGLSRSIMSFFFFENNVLGFSWEKLDWDSCVLAQEATTGCTVPSSFSAFALQVLWLSKLFFPGLFDAEDDRVEEALAIRLIIGRDFAVTRSSPESCCTLFAIASEQLVELKCLILNKHKRWFHSSCVKFPLVSMSASWFLVSMYLIWIFGSKFIRSNNQSSATLWVLETCLVGLLHLIIILITASLCSNTYNKASWCENWTFEGNTVNIIQNVQHSSRLLAWLLTFVMAYNGLSRSIMVLNRVSKD